jgi:multiple sugar transport system ATP-binding protein
VSEDVDLGGSMEEGSDPGEILMSVGPDSDIREEQDVEVVLDRSKLHLFDDQGDAVVHGLVETPGAGAVGEAEAEGDD